MRLATRQQFFTTLFSGEVPRLWCPPLTHYDATGAIDAVRFAAHLEHLAPNVRCFLIPGSTGDGWELSSDERRQLLALALEQVRKLKAFLLIGALHPDLDESLKLIRDDLDWLKLQTAESDAFKALASSRVCGFTICPPRGQSLTQQQIRTALSCLLDLGLPTAIYQLPQVTLNELTPDSAAELAQRHPNFLFFKDTSGSDKVTLSGKDLSGVFTLRGAEGEYARWIKSAGGPYDGFLLSSANCFARELSHIISVDAGRVDSAHRLSQQVHTAIDQIFKLAADVPHGNAFANGNKAFDHFFAHGPDALNFPPPRLHAGASLPAGLIERAREILVRQQLLPAKGYLSDSEAAKL